MSPAEYIMIARFVIELLQMIKANDKDKKIDSKDVIGVAKAVGIKEKHVKEGLNLLPDLRDLIDGISDLLRED